eukprot:scaffold612_cov343-Prasinococcus_capsulatus_cf.AAC.5
MLRAGTAAADPEKGMHRSAAADWAALQCSVELWGGPMAPRAQHPEHEERRPSSDGLSNVTRCSHAHLGREVGVVLGGVEIAAVIPRGAKVAKTPLVHIHVHAFAKLVVHSHLHVIDPDEDSLQKARHATSRRG